MTLSEFSVNKPITTLMVVICVVTMGGISISQLPLNTRPEFAIPFLRINANYPSSSPEEIEQSGLAAAFLGRVECQDRRRLKRVKQVRV